MRWRRHPLWAVLSASAAALLGVGAGAEPGASQSLIVKLRGEGSHAVHACAETRFERGESLAAASADGSDSLDRLRRELDVRSVRALFRRPDGSVWPRPREQLRARIRSVAARRGRPLPERVPDLSHVYRIELGPGVDAERALERFRGDPHVEYAQPNGAVDLDDLDDPFVGSSGSWGQSYADQWGLHAIGAPSAWPESLGSGVVVAIVDTGVDLGHPDLAANLWIHPGEDRNGNGRVDPEDRNGIDDDGNGFVDDLRGYDFQGSPDGPPEDADPQDENGHGTHVAGIVAARGGNGIGIAGVAPRATLMPVRVFPPLGGAETDVVWRGVLYAAENGADIVNASFSCRGVCRSNPIAEEVIGLLSDLGVAFVTSAGNSASDVMLKSPERLRESIVVGNLDPFGSLAASSSFGWRIDVVAPGVDVLSLAAAAAPDFYASARFVAGDYLRLSGTSMAAPHVSGTLALLLSRHPGLSPEALRALIRSSARDLGAEGPDPRFGSGQVSAAEALAAGPPPELSGRIDAPLAGDTLSGLEARLPVWGRIEGRDARGHRVELGAGEAPTQWQPLDGAGGRREAGRLAELPAGELPDGAYVLRLSVADAAGKGVREFVPFSLERTRPVLMSAPETSAAGLALSGRRVVWSSPRGEAAEEQRELVAGRFRQPGEALLVEAPGDQRDVALAGRWMAWRSTGPEGDDSLQACRLEGGPPPRCRPFAIDSGERTRGRLALSGRQLVFTELLAGVPRLRRCELGRDGCTPRGVAPEVAGPFAPVLDAGRLVWRGFRPGTGLALFHCLVESCDPQPLHVLASSPQPLALSGTHLLYSAFSGASLSNEIFVCAVDFGTGDCPPLRLHTLPTGSIAQADLSESRVVWTELGAHGASDIFYCEYDAQRASCPRQRLTSDAAPQQGPRIDGSRVVWLDEREGSPRVASLRLPQLRPLRARRMPAGRALRVPLAVTGAPRAAFSVRRIEGPGGALGRLEIRELGHGRAQLAWWPRSGGTHLLRVRATLPGGLYTERALEVEVRGEPPRGRRGKRAERGVSASR